MPIRAARVMQVFRWTLRFDRCYKIGSSWFLLHSSNFRFSQPTTSLTIFCISSCSQPRSLRVTNTTTGVERCRLRSYRTMDRPIHHDQRLVPSKVFGSIPPIVGWKVRPLHQGDGKDRCRRRTKVAAHVTERAVVDRKER